MGAWGTAISSNDTYADVYAEFFDQYNNGLQVAEITTNLINSNKDTVEDATDSNNFWFALAKAQWECKSLDQALHNKVKDIIKSGADLKIWRELGTDEKSLGKRKIALDKFLHDLSVPKLKAKLIKKKTIRPPIYSKGDCIIFKLKNDNYGGAIVLEAIYGTEYGYNLIATTTLNQPSKPTSSDFLKSNILIKNFGAYNDKPAINWFSPIRHKQIEHLFENTGTVQIEIVYDIKQIKYGFCADYDLFIINTANGQFEHDSTKGKSKLVLPVKQFIKKSKWEFW